MVATRRTAGHGCALRFLGAQTFIAGLSFEALMAPWVIKGAMDGEAFAAYIEHVLVPELEPGTVVILWSSPTEVVLHYV